MYLKSKLFVSIFSVFLIVGGCGWIEDLTEDEVKSQTPQPPAPVGSTGGAGASATMQAIGVVNAITGMFSQIPSALTPQGKPSLNAMTGVVVLPPLVTEPCDSGTFTLASSGNSFTLTANDCRDEQVLFNGTINGTFDPANNTRTCPIGDEETIEVPGTVNVTGSNFTVDVSGVPTTITGLQILFNITAYDSDCAPSDFTASFTGGTISGPLATITFPPNTLTLGVTTTLDEQGEHRQADISVNGTFSASSDTQCIAGDFTVITISSLHYPDTNDLCPQSGDLEVNDGTNFSFLSFNNGDVTITQGDNSLGPFNCQIAQACLVPQL